MLRRAVNDEKSAAATALPFNRGIPVQYTVWHSAAGSPLLWTEMAGLSY